MKAQCSNDSFFKLSFTLLLILCGCTVVTGCSWTTLGSLSTAGQQGNDDSFYGALSSDGRYLAFSSDASNLVPGDTNSTTDVFVRDTLNNTTTRVSVTSGGEEGAFYLDSSNPSISHDGRYIAFISFARLAPPRNSQLAIFVHDRINATTEQVSISSAGEAGNGESYDVDISGDGRYVAFKSTSSNLVPNDTNGWDDIFVHDRETGTTSRVSVDSTNNEANGFSESPSISYDGRYVAFTSDADNLVPGDTNGFADAFVHDRVTATTTRVSVDSNGEEADAPSSSNTISDDGRYVIFTSRATNLVLDGSASNDVYVHDRDTGLTSLAKGGSFSPRFAYKKALSADGRYIVFSSTGSDLVPDDNNGVSDIFLSDQQTGTTTRVSLDAVGQEANGASIQPAISADGRYVAFRTSATNLVPNDSNGHGDLVVRAITPLSVTSAVPNMLPIGETTSVTLTGAYFMPGIAPLLKGAEFSNMVILDENTITVDITVAAGQSSGAKKMGTDHGFLSPVII